MKRNRIPALLLAMLLTLSLSVSAFAAGSTTATVPVTLTVDNQYRAVNVTVPSSLPVYVTNGTVITADNAKITNNSKTGVVQVTAISVTDGAYKVGSYDSFSGAGKMSITKDAFPKIGAAQNLPLTYFAKVSGDAPNSKDVQAANVVFTISIVG